MIWEINRCWPDRWVCGLWLYFGECAVKASNLAIYQTCNIYTVSLATNLRGWTIKTKKKYFFVYILMMCKRMCSNIDMYVHVCITNICTCHVLYVYLFVAHFFPLLNQISTQNFLANMPIMILQSMMAMPNNCIQSSV